MQTINTFTPETSGFARIWKSFNKASGALSLLLTVSLLLGGSVLWYRDSNVANAARLDQLADKVTNNRAVSQNELTEIKARIAEIESNSVSKAEFERSVSSLERQLDRIYNKVK